MLHNTTDYQLITRCVVKKGDIGVHDNLFGGTMMSWLDEAGAIMASIIGEDSKFVTRNISEITFHEPVKVNSIVTCYGKVIRVGRTSINLELVARKLYPETSEEIDVVKCQMTFVKINQDGKPSPISKYVKDKLNA